MSDRIIHMAKLISPQRDVSPLCAKVPKAIDLKRESWTDRAVSVTCDKCLAILNGTAPAGGEDFDSRR